MAKHTDDLDYSEPLAIHDDKAYKQKVCQCGRPIDVAIKRVVHVDGKPRRISVCPRCEEEIK